MVNKVEVTYGISQDTFPAPLLTRGDKAHLVQLIRGCRHGSRRGVRTAEDASLRIRLEMRISPTSVALDLVTDKVLLLESLIASWLKSQLRPMRKCPHFELVWRCIMKSTRCVHICLHNSTILSKPRTPAYVDMRDRRHGVLGKKRRWSILLASCEAKLR